MFYISGFGIGFVFTNCIVVLGYYFHEKLALANGLGLSGGSVGMLFFAPLIRCLIDAYSWRGAMLICSGMLGNICVFSALFRMTQAEVISMAGVRPESQVEVTNKVVIPRAIITDSFKESTKKPKLSIVSTVKRTSRAFVKSYTNILSIRFAMICVLSPFLFGFGYYTTTIFFVSNAINLGIPKTDAAFLLSIFGIAGTAGRLSFGRIVDKNIVSLFHLASLLLTIAGSSCFVGTLARSYVALVIAVILGFSASTANVMFPLLIREVVGASSFKKFFGIGVALFNGASLISLPLMGKYKIVIQQELGSECFLIK